jgi:hypothetical protein
MWQVHLTSWKKRKHLHLLHLPSKDRIGVLASPPRYNPYYYGKNSAPIAHPSQITISDSIYLNSPLHWILDNSQIGGSFTRETDLRDSDRQLLLLQALLGCLMTKGEKIRD